jgi:prepilin-type N-terminal cleavage/methylation domain-containing protein
MKTSFRTPRSRAGWTLTEMMVAVSLISVITTGAFFGMMSLHRSFSATMGYSTHLGDELRISDYIARDLRQATSVTKTGTGINTRLTLTIPNYYAADGTPRVPIIDNKTGGVSYQDSAGVKTVPVVYYINGTSMNRSLNGTPKVIAANVEDFDLFILDSATTATATTDFNFSDISGKVAEVKLQVRFKTAFRRLIAATGVNPATALYNTTLLRNVRTDAPTGLY